MAVNFKRDSLFNIKLKNISTITSNINTKVNMINWLYFQKCTTQMVEVTLNNKNIDHFPVNYILRGVIIPKGEHKIKFSFIPEKLILGTSIRWISLILFLMITLLSIFKNKRFISDQKSSK